VFRAARALQQAGVAALRFNFRGVGRSEGVHDDGRGEQDDVRAALDEAARRFPGLPLWRAASPSGPPWPCARAAVTRACARCSRWASRSPWSRTRPSWTPAALRGSSSREIRTSSGAAPRSRPSWKSSPSPARSSSCPGPTTSSPATSTPCKSGQRVGGRAALGAVRLTSLPPRGLPPPLEDQGLQGGHRERLWSAPRWSETNRPDTARAAKIKAVPTTAFNKQNRTTAPTHSRALPNAGPSQRNRHRISSRRSNTRWQCW
jgi:hypothetical protein